LNDQRKKEWEKTVEAANFTHSSRKAWKMLKKLGTDAIPASLSNVNNCQRHCISAFARFQNPNGPRTCPNNKDESS
jgi:hypothetical protein